MKVKNEFLVGVVWKTLSDTLYYREAFKEISFFVIFPKNTLLKPLNIFLVLNKLL
jgi:hypothetical protein